MDGYQALICDIAEGTATVTINRPESFNAINTQVLVETARLFKELADNPDVKAVILGGGNEAFYAVGADIRELIDASPVEAETYITLAHEALAAIYHLAKPTIAAVSGLALGGGLEIILVCDLRIASENAVFGLPEINLGVLPGGGGTQLLPKIIGPARAKELIFSGELFEAQTALTYGLVNKVVPFAQLMPEAQKMARKLSRKPPIALALAKELVNSSHDLDYASGQAKEKQCFSSLFATNDQKEGMKAFMENRRAVFKGN